ncbi:Uu.00g095340.m01.CDS01 [Anthostomella pinea]|uniref:Uu.00g095340.m01.CDS01 n=1 Tax=Anthostomella pinea TaxID=933095 RepID=A0AAI8YMW5_9PEZI|nr:Uu.00g095340.m01.CDS01 [Anthostomella pinea]
MTTPTLHTSTDQNADFLKRFSSFENKKRQHPKPLSVEEHVQFCTRAKSVKYVRPKLSEGTEINIGGILDKWKRFCKELLKTEDWRTVIKTIEVSTIIDFCLHICESDRIKAQESLKQYFRRFQQLYTSQTGNFMNRNDSHLVYTYMHAVLVPLYRLRPPNTNKPVLGVEALCSILTFNIAYDLAIQPLKRQRVQLSGCYQLLCYTGVRPAELVCNERKKPKDGTVEEIFGVNGVLSICTDSRLINSTRQGELDKSEVKEITDDGEGEVGVSKNRGEQQVERGRPKALCYEDILLIIAMAYAKLRDNMGEQSLNAGFEERWTPKFCRRGAGNAVNGDAPDSIQDQMIRHDPKFATFHSAYQNHNL